MTFENIQGLQKQNKKLLEIVRSLSQKNDEQEVQLIKDLKVITCIIKIIISIFFF